MTTKIIITLNGFRILVSPMGDVVRLADILCAAGVQVTEVRLQKQLNQGSIIIAHSNDISVADIQQLIDDYDLNRKN